MLPAGLRAAGSGQRAAGRGDGRTPRVGFWAAHVSLRRNCEIIYRSWDEQTPFTVFNEWPLPSTSFEIADDLARLKTFRAERNLSAIVQIVPHRRY